MRFIDQILTKRTLQQLISPERFCDAQQHQLASVETKCGRQTILRSISSPVQYTQIKCKEMVMERRSGVFLKGKKLFSLHGDLSLSYLGSNQINPEHGYKFSAVLFQHQHCICQKKIAIINKP